MKTIDWTIEGSDGHPIHGTTHAPNGDAVGVVLLAHGFMGYKEYGMFPWIAKQFASRGYIAHRFNFSHSGMLAGDGPFDRLDLFEQATWNRQVDDLQILALTYAQPSVPLILFGHSRGGVSTLLSLGRGVVSANSAIVLSSPSTCLSMDEETTRNLVSEGRLAITSGRTGQKMHVGKAFVEEQLADPDGHNLLDLAKKIEVPCLVIHGDEDPTVPPSQAVEIKGALQKPTLILIPGGDHVFNTPNPFPSDAEPSKQLAEVWGAIEQQL